MEGGIDSPPCQSLFPHSAEVAWSVVKYCGCAASWMGGVEGQCTFLQLLASSCTLETVLVFVLNKYFMSACCDCCYVLW